MLTLVVYEACGGGALDYLHGFSEIRTMAASFDDRFAHRGSECSAKRVLSHALGAAEANVEYMAFLSAVQPGETELRLLQLSLTALHHRTFDMSYLALGMKRAAPYIATSCERAMWRDRLGLRGRPAGYEGARFLVKAARVYDVCSTGACQSLLNLLEDPPTSCANDWVGSSDGKDGSEVGHVQEVLASGWHFIFGEQPDLPIRSDDNTLPLFLRVLDGPSGFERTRLPKTSTYLASSQILMEAARERADVPSVD